MNRFFLISILLFVNTCCFAQNANKDTLLNLISELNNCKNDTSRLNKLFEIHYLQQAIIGELNDSNINKFNTSYTKEAIALATKLEKYDTLKSLTVDLGYIFDLGKNFDSSFVYYNNCFNIFEATNNYQLTFSIAQNILYNNSSLQSIIAEHNKKAAEQKKKIDRLTCIAFFILLIFIVFLIYSFRKTKRSNVLLEEQKRVIIESKTEIENSINYAQNLQQAILSNETNLRGFFKKSFVLFMPRDKVSGDFLWTFEKDNSKYVAVVDCTGHGVPGAILSIVGHSLFDNILSSTSENSPANILELLHSAIVKTLKQHHEINSRDGMDVGIFRVDLLDNKLFYAGAHRSLYQIRNNEIKEFKGTRRPVGGTQVKYEKSFLEYEIDLQKDDLVYCYSDGFPDQMGGPKNKKLMNAKLLKILLDSSDKKMDEQKAFLKSAFCNYMGENPQTDDVLLIGVKF